MQRVERGRSRVRPAAPASAQRAGSTVTLGDEGGARVRRTVLPGGLRIVTESLPGARSVAFGVWVGVGSRDEVGAQAGSAHYLEHLLFKGTSRRSALEISSSIDSVGGELNAFTSKEYTCFYARVLDVDLPLAVDVVTDVVTGALVRDDDVDSERDVILEEIAMRDDDPSDVVHEEFAAAFHGPSALGRSILGTVDTISGITPRAIRGFYKRRYQPGEVVVAVAGSLDHTRVVAMVRKAMKDTGWLDGDGVPAPPRAGTARYRGRESVRLLTRPTEQAHVVLGVPGLARHDERLYALSVLNASFGGGMSSRLFQEVREKRGLAYSVFSFGSQYADGGVFGVYAGCTPRKVDDVLAVCRDELAKIADSGLTEAELASGKGQVRGGTVLSLEDTGSRMSRIGKAELLHGELRSITEVLDRIDAVTIGDVRELAAQLLRPDPTLAVIGPFDDTAQFESSVA